MSEKGNIRVNPFPFKGLRFVESVRGILRGVRSMTGFGSGESRRDGIRAIVEIRSVNARFFEARLRLPAEALPLEVEVRRKVSEVVRRGKVDLTASFEAEALPGVRLRVNRGLAAEYLHAAEQLRQEFHLDGAVGLPQLLAVPGLMEIERSESAMDPGFATILMEALEAALQSHDGARRVEGNQLGADLDRHLEDDNSFLGHQPTPVVSQEAPRHAMHRSRVDVSVRVFVDQGSATQATLSELPQGATSFVAFCEVAYEHSFSHT